MIIERTVYTPKPGRIDEVLAIRRRASAVRRAIGLRGGEISVLSAADGAPVQVQWQCRFDSPDARQADMDARAASADFEAVRKAMGAVIDAFDRHVLTIVPHGGSVLRDTGIDGVPIVPRQVTFPSAGRDLAGFLFLPPGPGPFPCMVTNHGSGIHQGSQDWCRPNVAALLMSWGIASFLPHRRGYGNSPGAPWRMDVSAEFGTAEYDAQLGARLDAESDDVVAARAFVAALPDIDPDHLGVMGSSFGGTVTLLAAAKDPAFRCAVEFAGAAMNWDRTPGLRALMHAAAGRLTQPVFFLQAANDYSVRPTHELAAGLDGSGKVVRAKVFADLGLTRDEGHFLYRDGTAIWGPEVRDFLEDHL